MEVAARGGHGGLDRGVNNGGSGQRRVEVGVPKLGVLWHN